jgi:two-component system sensor histidine kinase MprB
MSLRTRIAAVAGLAVAIAVCAAAIAVYVAVRSTLRGEVEEALRARAAQVVDPRSGGYGHRGGLGLGGGYRLDSDSGPFGGASGYAQLVLSDGRVLGPGGAAARIPVRAETAAIARRGAGTAVEDQRVAGTHLLVLTVGIPPGALQVARPLDEVDDQLRSVLVVLAVVVGAGVALGAGLGAVVASAALAPVARFTRRTEAIAAHGELTERMDVHGDDELARLGRSFNTTLDALQRSVDAQRQLVADASHELRTPLASLRANVQVLEEAERLPPAERAALREDIVHELDELTALVGDVVELARGSRPAAASELDDVRLDVLVAESVERARRRAGHPEAVRAILAPDVVVHGEPQRIARALTNLLDNARKWSPLGGVVEVELDDQGTVSVRDHGPGFDAEDLPHVFERFYRAADARGRPGSGLGLAIVRQAAEAHGGSVHADNAPSGGAIVRVRFSPAG